MDITVTFTLNENEEPKFLKQLALVQLREPELTAEVLAERLMRKLCLKWVDDDRAEFIQRNRLVIESIVSDMSVDPNRDEKFAALGVTLNVQGIIEQITHRQLQIKNGFAQNEWNDSGEMPVPPDASWTFVDVTNRPDAKVGMSYDTATDTFSPSPVVVPKIVSKSQIISVLTQAEWQTATTSTDVDVVWGMAQFALVDLVDLSDPKISQLLTSLIPKNILTAGRVSQIQAALVALANA